MRTTPLTLPRHTLPPLPHPPPTRALPSLLLGNVQKIVEGARAGLAEAGHVCAADKVRQLIVCAEQLFAFSAPVLKLADDGRPNGQNSVHGGVPLAGHRASDLLSEAVCDALWNCAVERQDEAADGGRFADCVFGFFTNVIDKHMHKEFVPLLYRLCSSRLNVVSLSATGLKLVRTVLLLLNAQEGKISFPRSNPAPANVLLTHCELFEASTVVDDFDLLGLDLLWEIIRGAEAVEVANEATELLIR